MTTRLTRQNVIEVATLARLKLTDAEIDDFTTKLGQVLEYFEMLNEVDTENVEPMVHAVELSNVFREDAALPSLPRPEALGNAPKSDGQFFLVPQILSGS